MVNDAVRRTIHDSVCNELSEIARELASNGNSFCDHDMIEDTLDLLNIERMLDCPDVKSKI